MHVWNLLRLPKRIHYLQIMSSRVIIQSECKESSGTVYFIILTMCQEVSTSPKHRPNYKIQFYIQYIYSCEKEHIANVSSTSFNYYFYSKLVFSSWNSNREAISLSGGYFINISICSNFGNSIQFKACPSSCQLFLIQHCCFKLPSIFKLLTDGI